MKCNFSKVIIGLMAILILCGNAFADELLLFCGAAFKKPIDEAISLYEKRSGTKIHASYGGVKTVMSQAMLIKQGDVLVVPSPDIMDTAVEKGVVHKGSIRGFSYAVPSIIVHKGNPKNIKRLNDLLRHDVRFAMANPENVYIGMLAAEIFERNLSRSEMDILKKKVLTYAEDISKLTTYLIMNQVDAVLGFDFLKGWNPDKTDMVKLKKEEIIRIGAGQAGVMTYSRDTEKAKKFIEFLLSVDGQNIFRKYGYIATEEDAFSFVGKKVEIGGKPEFAEEWIKK